MNQWKNLIHILWITRRMDKKISRNRIKAMKMKKTDVLGQAANQTLFWVVFAIAVVGAVLLLTSGYVSPGVQPRASGTINSCQQELGFYAWCVWDSAGGCGAYPNQGGYAGYPDDNDPVAFADFEACMNPPPVGTPPFQSSTTQPRPRDEGILTGQGTDLSEAVAEVCPGPSCPLSETSFCPSPQPYYKIGLVCSGGAQFAEEQGETISLLQEDSVGDFSDACGITWKDANSKCVGEDQCDAGICTFDCQTIGGPGISDGLKLGG